MPQHTEFNDRENLSLAEQQAFEGRGTLIVDDRRRRPLWFDGRFLDAAALNSEQSYFIARQDDIAHAVGVGVINGLRVNLVESQARTLEIDPGQGITPSGEVVTLPEAVRVDLADIARSQALDLTFGVASLPSDPPANQSGIFIVALRRVQYTAEPTAAYPTSIDGERSVEDGSVIEATLVTLVPYTDQGTLAELTERRKHVAREIFVDGSLKGQPLNVLPLAVVAVSNGVIKWLDNHLVRRHVGAPRHQIPGLGLAPRVVREAHLLQYRGQLDELLAERPQGFTASEEFVALPAAGPMPAGAVNADNFTQTFFPAEMDVELSIVPEDELYAVVEDSFSLPPMDLGGSTDELEATSVLVLIPVPRHELRGLSLSLPSLVTTLKPATPGIIAAQKPVATLAAIGGFANALKQRPSAAVAESAWRGVLQKHTGVLWYTRRRSVAFKSGIVGAPVTTLAQEQASEAEVETAASDNQASGELTTLNARTTLAARAEAFSLLGSLRTRPILFRGALNDIVRVAARPATDTGGNNTDDDSTATEGPIGRRDTIAVRERYTASRFGEGLSRLTAQNELFDTNRNVVRNVGTSGRVTELDKLASRLPPPQLGEFSRQLIDVARTNSNAAEQVKTLIDERLKTLDPPADTAR